MLIGEAAKQTGLKKTTIRYYESIGLIRADRIEAGSREYFDYSEHTVHLIKFIKHAQGVGFTLSELKEIIPDWYAGTLTGPEKVKRLKKKLEELGEKKQHIIAMEEELKRKIDIYTKNPNHG